MKKNWLSYICVATLLSGVLTSCNESNFLDLSDPNHFTENNFWRNKADAESGLAAAYSPIKYQMNGYYGAFDGWLNLNSRGDDIFTILNEEASMWAIATFQNSSTTGNDPYGALYAGIQRANLVLKNIDLVPATDESNKPAAKEEQLWKQVEDDLKDAIDCNLPVTRSGDEKGRIEKGAAIAMLGKVYLYQHKYPEAKAQLQLLMSAPYYPGRYDLIENFAENFTTANENNKESVFELQYSSDGELTWGNESGISLGNSLPQFVGPVAGGGWAKLMPSSFAVGQFVKEERPAGSDTKFDKRIYASLFFNPEAMGDVVKNEKWYGGNRSMEDLWDGNSGKMTGGAPTFSQGDGKFLLKKYTAYFVNATNADNMGHKEGKANNLRAMRFSEVLLMYAEACAMTNDANGANTALKIVRQRAGLAEKTFAQADLMAEIEHQCLLEFFGEGHRFDDLKRWYTTEEIKNIFTENEKQGAEYFQEKHKYYPIPSGELNNNDAMVQTELWR